jgi:para-nitrobenzyl esterase
MRRRANASRSWLLLATLAVTLLVPRDWPVPRDAPLEAQDGSCLVATASGQVQGVRRDASCTYLGIPYAAAPVGVLRWRPPQPRAPWSPTILNATVAPMACAQINLAGALAGTEDCLTVNIWTPAARVSARGAPVLVWLHPGGFVAASSNLAASDGRRFAEETGTVVIAANYRLGPFGFLSLRRLIDEDPGYRSAGNYGLADQRAALQWVRANVSAFGGDPDNVTLAGTSAGGISTGLHLVSPGSRGLFQRAIVQSGPPTTRLPSAVDNELQGVAFAAALDCPDNAGQLACLRAKTRDQVLTALPVAGLTGGLQTFVEQTGRVAWGPSVDGLELPDQPRDLYRRGLFSRIPLIIGSNLDDGWTFVDRSFPAGLDVLQYERAVQNEFGMDAAAILRTYPPSAFPTPKDALARLATDVEFACEVRRVARAMHDDGAPVYVYSFEYFIDAVAPGRAFHGIEPNLLFGNNFGAPSNHVLTNQDLALFRSMSTYWRQFADTGTPNARDNPTQWPLFRALPWLEPYDPSRSDRYLRLDRLLSEDEYLRDSQCNFWEPFFFRTIVGAVPAAAR